MLAPPLNLPRWLSENGDKLQPPVNNFCLYAGKDHIVMAVGGPNERNDYHINETEVGFCILRLCGFAWTDFAFSSRPLAA